MTVHQLYLQLRQDILESRIRCTEEQSLHVASLALQAEFGDYQVVKEFRNYFAAEHYVAQRLLRRTGTVYVKDKLPALHSRLRGISEAEAETRYIMV